MLLLLLLFSLQYSSFYASVILLPCSVFVMMLIASNITSFSLFFYLLVMMFLGGLLILLVSVTSVIASEQSLSMSFSGWTLLILPLVSMIGIISMYENYSTSTLGVWISTEHSSIMFMLMLLIWELASITFILSKHKGLIRGICSLGVMHGSFSENSF